MALKTLFATVSRRYSSSKPPTPRQAELMAKSLPKRSQLPGVDKIIVVASGKGGVGKSTTAVNLACTLSSMGKRIGLLDADVFGPSIPLMMNLTEEPLVDKNNLMIPLINYGIKCNSMGLLAQSGPIIWRGPLVMSALQRLLRGTAWGELDILVIDTPPGTGDIHLSLTQNVPISGVIAVSTPQATALEVTCRGVEMYKKFGVPIIGLVENMQNTICTNCKTRIEIFKSVTNKYVNIMNTEILVSIPIDGTVTESCDCGMPLSIKEPNSEYGRIFHDLGNKVIQFLYKQ